MRERIVPSAWLDRDDRRLDCGPYFSGGIEARALIDKLTVPKAELIKVTAGGGQGIFHAGREGRTWVDDPEYGIPFLSSSDVLQADFTSAPLISKKQIAVTPEFIIRAGWTLITRSGTVGRMVYCREDMDGFACSEHVMRVVPDKDKVLPGYLYAFLASRFGIPIVVGGTYGSVIQHLEPDHITDLPLPRFGGEFETRIHTLVNEAATLMSKYQAEVVSATDLFFRSVGLEDISATHWHQENKDVGFVRKLSSAASLRALNFNPRFEALCGAIEKVPFRKLGQLCKPRTLRRGGRYKRIDASPEYAYQLIAQKEIFWLRPEGRWIAKKSVDEDVLVEPGTTLVAARGTLGESELYCRSEFIWGKDIERAYSEDFLRVVSDESVMPRGCLYAFMRSETAFRMLRSISMGTKLQDHHPTFLKSLPVPYPDETVRNEVHEIVVGAYEKRHKALQLENEAIHMVEAQIQERA